VTDPIAGWRYRYLLSQASDLAPREEILAWARIRDPDRRRRGVIYIARQGCFVRWATGTESTQLIGWENVETWGITQEGHEGPLLCIQTSEGQTVVKLPALTNRMALNVSSFLAMFGELAPWPKASPKDEAGDPRREFHPLVDVSIRRERRSLPGYTKRVFVTVLGGALLVLGVFLSLPLVPGPGLLTMIAGLAILSTEYDFASDALDWARERYRKTKQRWKGRQAGDGRR
jgi:uncharacterized protein (TIGR02611 family)